MFPYYFYYNGKNCYDYYSKFFDSKLDDRWAYYRYKEEQYAMILQQCGIFSHDSNKEQDYCIYKPKEIIEDWAMVLGIKDINYHLLDGKIILYIKRRMANLPEDEKERKRFVFKELGFDIPQISIKKGNKTFHNIYFELACSRIITNFDISDIKDIFEKLGVIPTNWINWEMANSRYNVSHYNAFIYNGGDFNDCDKIVNAFGSLDIAKEIRNTFWEKRYPDEVAIMNVFKSYKEIYRTIKDRLTDEMKMGNICSATEEDTKACFIPLMIYKDRYEYLKISTQNPTEFSEKDKIKFLSALLESIESDSTGIPDIKSEEKEYFRTIVDNEIEKITPLYYSNRKDFIATYYKYHFQYMVKEELKNNQVFIPSEEKQMEGFIYYELLNAINWNANVGKQKKSVVVYDIVKQVGLSTCFDDDDDADIHKRVKTKIKKYTGEYIPQPPPN